MGTSTIHAGTYSRIACWPSLNMTPWGVLSKPCQRGQSSDHISVLKVNWIPWVIVPWVSSSNRTQMVFHMPFMLLISVYIFIFLFLDTWNYYDFSFGNKIYSMEAFFVSQISINRNRDLLFPNHMGELWVRNPDIDNICYLHGKWLFSVSSWVNVLAFWFAALVPFCLLVRKFTG